MMDLHILFVHRYVFKVARGRILEFCCRELQQFGRRAGLAVGFGFGWTVVLVC